MNVTIQIKDLKAVAYAMAVKDVRYYLNGVCVETNPKETRLIATDGSRFHIVLDTSREEDRSADRVQHILPATLVKRIIGCKVPKGAYAVAELSFEADRRVKVSLPDGSVLSDQTIDGLFPDYRRTIPTEGVIGEVKPANFNHNYIVDAYHGLNDYLGKKQNVWSAFAFYSRGELLGFLTYGGYMAGIMPLRECVYNKDISAFK